MSNTEYAIAINQVSKKYKIHNRSRDKILDLLGFGRFVNKRAQDFWALKDINMNIKKGSKVALIGRNGAGKSTLLKIIAGTLAQSSGTVTINGRVSALMELGTGFHPDFTGKENIFASLSYMGIVGKAASDLYQDIVEFSELEEFIERPVKTYSAGMYARLAFATSTATKPEILIIDEILGAGDAYFISKSMERMKRLTADGTTVLFVSHDMASVQKLCNEAYWIDRGQVVMSGHILDVSAEYMASVRRQEESRLVARNIRLQQNNDRSLEESLKEELVYVHFITDSGAPTDKHPISNIKLYHDKKLVDELQIGTAMDNNANNELFIISDSGENINWSIPKEENGFRYRDFEDLGGQFQHALVVFRKPAEVGLNHFIEITYKDISEEIVKVEYYDGEQYKEIGWLEAFADHQWKTARLPIAAVNEQQTPVIEDGENQIDVNDRMNNIRIYGSGEVIITKVKFYDANQVERHIFTSGEFKKARIYYYAKEEVLNPVFVLAYYLIDGTCAMQILSNKDEFNVSSVKGHGFIEINFDPLLLGRGNYLVSVAIFKELNLVDNVEPPAYDLHDKMYEIKIEQQFGLNVELGVINHPVRWGVKHGQ